MAVKLILFPLELISLARRLLFEKEVTKKCKNYPSILTIGVSPNEQGKGIGKRLIGVAEEYFRRNHYSSFFVDTEISNTKAIKFYQANGFITLISKLGNVLLIKSI
jgi:ribosomal protein S18 acetylase RimI-like enzyme